MIRLKLRQAMSEYQYRTGEYLTYERLTAKSGVPAATLRAIARRPGYSPSFDTFDKICRALQITPGDLLAYDPDKPQPKQQRSRARAKAKRGGKKTSKAKRKGKTGT